MKNIIKIAVLGVPVLLLGACTTLSKEDQATLTTASQNAADAKSMAQQALDTARAAQQTAQQASSAAQRAQETADKAESDAQAARTEADQAFQATQKKR
jgi:hypothetical protein